MVYDSSAILDFNSKIADELICVKPGFVLKIGVYTGEALSKTESLRTKCGNLLFLSHTGSAVTQRNGQSDSQAVGQSDGWKCNDIDR